MGVGLGSSQGLSGTRCPPRMQEDLSGMMRVDLSISIDDWAVSVRV